MKYQKSRCSNTPKINTASLSDVAFLLLIFFLVTTSAVVETGIPARLQPYTSCGPTIYCHSKNNMLNVQLNANNQLLVNGQLTSLNELKQLAKTFIANPQKSTELPESPTRAIVSLSPSMDTKYNIYIHTLNELRAAYHELWDEAAQAQFGFKYELLKQSEKRKIQSKIPIVLLENDSINY